MNKPLRHGYTTGACAAAAAKGAALMLVRQTEVAEVTIDLPAGVSATFPLHGQRFATHEASCFVVKDAGDDPDVTNGAELHARVAFIPAPPHSSTGENGIVIEGGTGVGKATKPGLAVGPGEWAINPVPRRMIEQAVREAIHDAQFTLKDSPFTIHHSRFTTKDAPPTLHVTISIPDGELRAQKTLNARLGIVGGLSILGTTGIVRPLSAKAWTDTIDAALDVARACGCPNVVLSTGRTSELAAQHHLNRAAAPVTALPEEAFVMMGDHVAYSLQSCARRGFLQPLVACQFAKLLKIACGHENTHAAASELDLSTLQGWAGEAGLPEAITATIAPANTAREIVIAANFDPSLLELVCGHAITAAQRHAPDLRPQFLVADYDGAIAFHGRIAGL
ncbi:cobalt-precorrin-5B (C(1))-methyltransferase CbiD [Oryzomonas rubra]|uniref:Cobalt-precorrin-5B C(1)-methyltransferase n=1 Tax=Oryzomonas rubra TaxID=2509454 RepID=A0A5A9XM70_9BACT|nr:cobalt-precorrin-5B (C(1))-methyltransferase CbiD [Oryzomonas rubra]KAA0894044.1 cobalt-precorrin-5B (C(1))-methyltransferase [Oryzomonas rubra]